MKNHLYVLIMIIIAVTALGFAPRVTVLVLAVRTEISER